MDQEEKTRIELDRAARAERLLNDEMFRETLDGLRAAYRKGWENTNADDAEGREFFYHSLRLLNLIEAHIEEHIKTGKMAQIARENMRAGRTAS